MRAGRFFACLAALALGMGTAGAVTKHYSFAGGYPTTTSRQSAQTTFGTRAETAKGGAKAKEQEKTLVGKVTRVESGDLIGVTPNGGRCKKIRLIRADAPEQGQPYGVEAKKFLFDLVNGQGVTVRYRTVDRAGVIRGTVYLDHEQGTVDVNLTLVKNGCAWYAEPPQAETSSSETRFATVYTAAQNDAKAAKRGLWATPNPVRPAEWRKLHK